MLCLTFPARKQPLELEFTRTLDSIREHTQWIDTEAFVAFHRLARELSSRNHEEILATIAAIPAQHASPVHKRSKHRLIPLPENPYFFGRQNELGLMSKELLAATKNKLAIYSIIGCSGVGKSQLALQFVYSHFEKFTAIFWVSADGALKTAQGYMDIAVEVGLFAKDEDGGGLDATRDAVKRWLRTTGTIDPGSRERELFI